MGQHREIRVGRGDAIALVDADDFEWLSRFRWKLNASGYAITTTPPYLRMHRLIVGLPKAEVDHKNGERLDNRKENLRRATHRQNCTNRRCRSATGFKGAYRNRAGTYDAGITSCGKSFYLGTFATPEDAARAYDAAARRLFGEFARLNFPDEEAPPPPPLPRGGKSARASSAYFGVKRHGNAWQARISRNGVNHYFGRFASELDAARAYDAGVTRLGLNARLNFPTAQREAA